MLPEYGELGGDLEAAGIEVLVRPLAVLRRSLMSPAGVSRVAVAWAADAGGLGRLARLRDVSLVHTNTSVTLGGSAAARVARVPHVWHVREIYTGFDRWWPAYRRLLTTADALPCVSRATRDQFTGLGPATVLHDGLAVVPRRADRAASRAALDLPQDATVLAVLGRISGWKGQDVSVRALASPALRDRKDVVLALAGDPWRGEERHLRELHEIAAAYGLDDRVRHIGFQDDVDAVYGAADIVLVPSKQPDPFPNAALEAAGAGCCVVASGHGGIPEMLRHDQTAVLVAPDDPEALAEAVAALVDDPARREALGAAAALDIAERFSTAGMLRHVQALYDLLLAR
ncbi:glycosyltransferase [Paraconexibacter sp. AEG42_29]|uniref:Glycosyltransferase n=1 Tax=Paraconexibacter sp. AEG42_29 TaxID=2997339 RepID=A0AAU7AZA4_9ACTN